MVLTLIPGWPSPPRPSPHSLGKRPSAPPLQPGTPSSRGPAAFSPPLALGPRRGRGRSCSGGVLAPPVTPAQPGVGVGEPIPAGGARPWSSSLPPAHTKTTRADRGACGRAPWGSGAHTHACPQGPTGSRMMDEGTRGRGDTNADAAADALLTL